MGKAIISIVLLCVVCVGLGLADRRLKSPKEKFHLWILALMLMLLMGVMP